MIISQRNFTLKLIQSTFSISPTNLCSFFWLGLSSYLMVFIGYAVQMPILLYNFFSTPRRKDYSSVCVLQDIHWLGRIFITLVSFMVLGGLLFKYKVPITVLSVYLLSLLALAVFVGVILLFIYVVARIHNFTQKRNIDMGPILEKIGNNWFVKGIIAFKEKTCKIITYK